MLWSVYHIISPFIPQGNFFPFQANVFPKSFMKTPCTFLCSFSHFVCCWLYHIHPALITIYFIMFLFTLRYQISLHITLIPHSPWDTQFLDDYFQVSFLRCNQIKQSSVFFIFKNLSIRLLLLLLSHFSRVRLCATPETAAHQAPPSLGFSRQEHWSGLPFPSPMHESEK